MFIAVCVFVCLSGLEVRVHPQEQLLALPQRRVDHGVGVLEVGEEAGEHPELELGGPRAQGRVDDRGVALVQPGHAGLIM